MEEELHAFLISALKLNCQLHAPAALPQYPLTRRLSHPMKDILMKNSSSVCKTYLCMFFISHASRMVSLFNTYSSFKTAADMCTTSRKSLPQKMTMYRSVKKCNNLISHAILKLCHGHRSASFLICVEENALPNYWILVTLHIDARKNNKFF